MQTKPDSDYTFFLCFDGYKLSAPIGMSANPWGAAWSWVQYANLIDIDGTYTAFNIFNFVNTLSFPTATDFVSTNRSKIINRVKKYYEIFDVNITDELSVFESTAVEKRRMVIVTKRPTVEEYNLLLEDKSEESYFAYSYRRFLLGVNPTVGGRNGTPDVIFQNPVYLRMGTWDSAGFTATKSQKNQESWGIGDVSKDFPSIVFSDYNDIGVFMDLSKSSKDRELYFSGSRKTSDLNRNDGTVESISLNIAHELGHSFPFEGHEDGSGHDGDINGNFVLGSYTYYRGHNNWGAIMGSAKRGTQLNQWSKGEYAGATNTVDDDISVINKKIPLIKKPKKSMSALSYTKEDSLIFENPYWNKSLGYNVRTLTKNDVEVIEENGKTKKIIKGLIGFPYDFDVIKMLLPPGDYTFTINPFFDENASTMLDPKLEILNCHCQESKPDNNPVCDQNSLPSFYPSDIDEDKMQCICFNDNLESLKSSTTNDGFFTVSVTESLSNRQIVYLKIRGDKNRTPSDGWSRYGSLGEYYLKITRNFQKIFSEDPSTFLSSNILPKCRCEEFNVCFGGSAFKTSLYVEDEAGGPVGNANEEHFIELDVIENGESGTKKFLVYGQPVNRNAQEEFGKLYLPIFVDGACKKQEFITAGG